MLWIITPACPNSTQCVDSKETSASAWFGIELVDVGYARFYGAINDAAAGCDEEESTRIPERGSGRKGSDPDRVGRVDRMAPGLWAALRAALTLKVVRPRAGRAATYGPAVTKALVKCWAVLRAPACS